MIKQLPVRLQRDGKNVLGILFCGGKKEFALAKFSELRKKPGWIVSEETLSEWHVQGFFESNGQLYLYGPYCQGIFLNEILKSGPDQNLFRLLNLIKALCMLKQKGIVIEHLQTDSVIFLDSGEILFLPPEIMKRSLDTRPLPYKLMVYDRINNPDLRGKESQLSFSLAVIFYRIITGEFPYDADNEEEIRSRMRNLRTTPPGQCVPELKPEVSKAIMQNLSVDDTKSFSLEEWRTKTGEWLKHGLFREIQESEKDTIRAKAHQFSQKAARLYRQKVYWQKHWKTIGIISIASVLILAFGISYIIHLLEPPATRGFPPQKVVETFYNGTNTMDHGIMEDCVTGDAGKGLINEVLHLFVMSRVTMGYEGKSNLIPADQWDEMGRPKLKYPQTVFGITNFSIIEIQGQPEPVYRVTYEKWTPGSAETLPDDTGSTAKSSNEQQAGSGPSSWGFFIKEIVSIMLKKEDWRIYKIELISSEPVSMN